MLPLKQGDKGKVITPWTNAGQTYRRSWSRFAFLFYGVTMVDKQIKTWTAEETHTLDRIETMIAYVLWFHDISIKTSRTTPEETRRHLERATNIPITTELFNQAVKNLEECGAVIVCYGWIGLPKPKKELISELKS